MRPLQRINPGSYEHIIENHGSVTVVPAYKQADNYDYRLIWSEEWMYVDRNPAVVTVVMYGTTSRCKSQTESAVMRQNSQIGRVEMHPK